MPWCKLLANVTGMSDVALQQFITETRSSLENHEKLLAELQNDLKTSKEYSQKVNTALDSAKKELRDRIDEVDQKAISTKTLADKLREDFTRAEELKKALNKVCPSPIFHEAISLF